MSNLLNETFQKHLKLVQQKLNLNETSDWGSKSEILEKVLQTLERDVEWPLTEILPPQEVKQLLAPIHAKINELMSSETPEN